MLCLIYAFITLFQIVENDSNMGNTYSTETCLTLDSDASGHKYIVRFDEQEIGRGACRIAYKGRFAESVPPGGPVVGYQCVVKIFKDKNARNEVGLGDQWKPDLIAHKRARKMAESFNKVQLNVSPRRIVRVLTPLIAKIGKRGGFYLLWRWNVSPVVNVLENEYVSLEPYLAGHWQKFNSNAGWSDESSTKLLQAFSHWTACKSGYRYLLCDLQGVKSDGMYLITDPCIHSVDQIHGPTDLGVAGMEMFLRGHKCNSICHELGLWRNSVPYDPSAKVGSTYSFQLTAQQKLQNTQKNGKYIHPMECTPEIEFKIEEEISKCQAIRQLVTSFVYYVACVSYACMEITEVK